MKQTTYPTVNSLFIKAELIHMQVVRVVCSRRLTKQEQERLLIISDEGPIFFTIQNQQNSCLTLCLSNSFPFGSLCMVGFTGALVPIQIKDVVRTPQFDRQFEYTVNDLGLSYTTEGSTFKVWTPTAYCVELILFKSWFTHTYECVQLKRETSGVWTCELLGDYSGYWYQYRVCNPGIEPADIVDPYAKYVSINGHKAMIGKLAPLLNQKSLDALPKEQSILYEMHVRDFSVANSSGIKGKATYKGLVESGTINEEGFTTGIDYVKQLGVTHVQIMPVQEFQTIDESNLFESYNWGYDTTHFFAIEGSYSEDPYHGFTRVLELRETINEFHKQDIRVILDVVYNHVYIWERSNLEKLVPSYYFRHTSSGEISNGTGVGNDLATEKNMVRKLIVDSIRYIINEFNIDGLRFDLMGIIDLKTMNLIVDVCNEYKKGFFLLGEGWNLQTAYPDDKLAILEQAKKLPGISFFDDQCRDALKGSIFSLQDKGFGHENSQLGRVKDALGGGQARFNSPTQAIHYVEVHDNQTLWDRLVKLYPDEGQSIIQRRHRLLTSMILLSQGIPFIHAGQEFCRTKFGIENSYAHPDWINQMDWNRRTSYNAHVSYVRGLIKLRKSYKGFQLNTFEEINDQMIWLKTESDFMVYQLQHYSNNRCYSQKMLVFHNGSLQEKTLNCKVSGIWQVCVDEKAASLVPLYSLRGEELKVSPLSTLVCIQ